MSPWMTMGTATVARTKVRRTVVAGDVDEAMREVIVNCSVVVIVFAVVPWRYVRQRYVAAKGDRWRGAAA